MIQFFKAQKVYALKIRKIVERETEKILVGWKQAFIYK